MIWAFLNGFGLSLSLILAVGAQNAFVLKQGLRREFVGPLVAFCAASDAVLMGLGVFGFGALTRAVPAVAPLMLWVGAVFVFAYGLLSFRRAFAGGEALDPATSGKGSLRAALAFCFAITWLNPHVYLDTVLLVGSVAAQFDGARVAFWAGASAGSALFFVALGYGARLLAPVMAKPRAWQILEFLIGVVMVVIAAGLVLSAL
ncbi:LysE/ArgO family amino acid transporter [Pseudooctadecabacter jejudonensis]|uniref:Arginine exporter protein ArgO n=1 Tax=Pseudooctadecabacter jejudonensis TaxID=1391910 RepID=A0A1Y5RTX7_9RHOB|nr:LysE/ArgO family amino acid transporter [Pseudooctadecabacter jejudonensis]SLN22629.1 Arginine exporter protein ArgO [Pseudooctadecabacter jejudonensis]